MSKTTTPQDDPRLDLLWDYLHGELDEDQVQAFEQTLRDNPGLVGVGLDLIELTVMTREVFQRGEAARQEAMLRSIADSRDASGAMEVLHELARMERDAPAQIVVLDPPRRRKRTDRSADPALTARDYADAGIYLLSRTLKSKAAVITAVAAMILLAFVLFNPFASDTGDAQDIADHTSPKPAESAPPILRDTPVATLTHTHKATWSSAEGASAPGSDLTIGSKLHPNQRLTLTTGFAQITTARGAIALLEAPATIEFTDHDNAIRLHAGTIVGICETESSKGFLVHTPHTQITDLGTRFGIQANADATEVHVIEGEVQAEKVNAAPGTEPTVLVAQQSARASADAAAIVRTDFDDTAFAAMLPDAIQLPGTGKGLRVGQIDPNWQIVATDGQPLDTPHRLRVDNSPTATQHFRNDPATSQLIAWNPEAEPPGGGYIAYTFETQIDVPDTFDPSRSKLILRYMADNQVAALTINGNRVVVDGHVFETAFDRWDRLVIDRHLVAGQNTIRFEVHNQRPHGNYSSGKVGIRLKWELVSSQGVFQ